MNIQYTTLNLLEANRYRLRLNAKGYNAKLRVESYGNTPSMFLVYLAA